MKFRFTADVVVEASSEEDALNRIGARVSAITRHLGNGEKLAASEPFFKLVATTDGDAYDMAADPIVAAARAKAEAAEKQTVAEGAGDVPAELLADK
jgi:hypothetical protein